MNQRSQRRTQAGDRRLLPFASAESVQVSSQSAFDPAAYARYGHSLSQSLPSAPIQRQAAGAAPKPSHIPITTGGGSPIPVPVRGKMERSFGHSFADVRIHSGAEAEAVGALAYTRGSDIHFQPGLYDPVSMSGQELLGHELTHVVQQRAGRVSSPQNKAAGAAPINADAGLEAEADALGTRAARGENAMVSGLGSGIQLKADSEAPIQCKGPLGWLRSKLSRSNAPEDEMTDADVTTQTQGPGVTSARVDRMDYNRPIGSSNETRGFFKPEWTQGKLPTVMEATSVDDHRVAEIRQQAHFDSGKNSLHPDFVDADTVTQTSDPRLGARAVASSRLNRALKTNVIAEEVFAEHNGEKGSSSAAVPGRAIQEYDPGAQMQRHNNHDFANPVTQKTLSDLQVNHWVSGQKDAHGGNVFIDPASGRANGIDNDGSFLSTEDDRQSGGHWMNMPQQIDAGTAKNILKLKAKTFPKLLNDGKAGHTQLNEAEIAAAQARHRALKQHVRALKKQGGLVQNWDNTTYHKSISDNAAGEGERDGGYVGRSQFLRGKTWGAYKEENGPPQPVQAPQLAPVNPLVGLGPVPNIPLPAAPQQDDDDDSDDPIARMMDSRMTDDAYAPNSDLVGV